MDEPGVDHAPAQGEVKFSWGRFFLGALISLVIQFIAWLGSGLFWLFAVGLQPLQGPLPSSPADWATLFWLMAGLFVYLPLWLVFTLPFYTCLWICIRGRALLISTIVIALILAIAGPVLFIVLRAH